MQEGLWNLSFLVDKDSILIKVGISKNYMDSKMINAWTQVKSYHGHFEISQTIEIPKHMEDRNLDFLEELLPWSEHLPTECKK